MTVLLDPTNDVVFKIMFSRPDSTDLLVSLLTAVLRPPSPISEVTLLNAALDKNSITDRGVVLDLHLRLEDRSQINVEMQARRISGMRERAVYHVARMYGSAIVRGQLYSELAPCAGIFLLGYDELPSARFHSTFRLLEVHDHVPLSPQIEIHFVELLKLRRMAPSDWTQESALADWARFFRPVDERDREELAMKDPVFTKACKVLAQVSEDPDAQYLARAREEGEVLWAHEVAVNRREARDDGLREGRDEGLREGRVTGLAQSVSRVLEARGFPLSNEIRERIDRCSDPALLERWLARAAVANSIDAVFE